MESRFALFVCCFLLAGTVHGKVVPKDDVYDEVERNMEAEVNEIVNMLSSINLLEENSFDAKKSEYSLEDPLSDEFIDSINSMNTTWKVNYYFKKKNQYS